MQKEFQSINQLINQEALVAMDSPTWRPILFEDVPDQGREKSKARERCSSDETQNTKLCAREFQGRPQQIGLVHLVGESMYPIEAGSLHRSRYIRACTCTSQITILLYGGVLLVINIR